MKKSLQKMCFAVIGLRGLLSSFHASLSRSQPTGA